MWQGLDWKAAWRKWAINGSSVDGSRCVLAVRRRLRGLRAVRIIIVSPCLSSWAMRWSFADIALFACAGSESQRWKAGLGDVGKV